jgi:ribonuclease Y
MTEILILTAIISSLMLGSVLGYYARQSIAKRKAGTIEAELQKKIEAVKKEAEEIIAEARERATNIIKRAETEEEKKKRQLSQLEDFLRKKEINIEKRIEGLENKEAEIKEKIEKLKEIKGEIETLKEKTIQELERISQLSKEEAKMEFFQRIENEFQIDILERIKKLQEEGEIRYEQRAKEILATAIERFALPQVQETTTTTILLPNEEIKGRIIGKEGRNIKTFENLTGVELIVDETPEMVTISCFNPIRREIARLALEKLIKDGRIQPARIEQEVEKAEKEISEHIKKAGENAIYETKVLGVHPSLVQILGRLKYRTSYGQNVLLHSIEVSLLASALASELGADIEVCKRAGLFHDIGKALDYQIEGSHIEIGVKILEKFGERKEVILAMRAHHQEYEPETLEAVVVKVADQISGARPGARRDTLENYLQRLDNLEKIALSFNGVEKAYAIQAGRELRVFVNSEQIDDLRAIKLAKEIVKNIEEELKYPGEIKVTLIREKRIVEYAK